MNREDCRLIISEGEGVCFNWHMFIGLMMLSEVFPFYNCVHRRVIGGWAWGFEH